MNESEQEDYDPSQRGFLLLKRIMNVLKFCRKETQWKIYCYDWAEVVDGGSWN